MALRKQKEGCCYQFEPVDLSSQARRDPVLRKNERCREV
jgi:hypothetical protein